MVWLIEILIVGSYLEILVLNKNVDEPDAEIMDIFKNVCNKMDKLVNILPQSLTNNNRISKNDWDQYKNGDFTALDSISIKSDDQLQVNSRSIIPSDKQLMTKDIFDCYLSTLDSINQITSVKVSIVNEYLKVVYK